MNPKIKRESLVRLRIALQGELRFDEVSKLIYSTDASSYREIPIAVAYPKSNQDIKTLVKALGKEEKYKDLL